MTDRESLNPHNVAAGVGLLVNRNAVSRSVDINCSASKALDITSALLPSQHQHTTDKINYFSKERRLPNYLSILLNLDKKKKKHKCFGFTWNK